KRQFQFNSEIEDSLKQTLWAVENNKIDYVKECLNEATEKLKNRNKLIRIADSSEGGWETVRQYDVNPLADDSDDESRIRRAEARAVRKKKNKRPSKRSRGTFSPMYNSGGHVPWNVPVESTSGKTAVFPASAARPDYSFRAYSAPAFPGTATGGPFSGACFACGAFNHFRKNCPYVSGGESGGTSAARK
ncbi:MAG: hypothetical protein ABW092_14610, partial [Candidatus Thiodiazotropha sp.]